MSNDRKLYLITLEIEPLDMGKAYNPLPSHLTLVSRFWSSMAPADIAKVIRPVCQQSQPIELTFEDEALLGPKHVAVQLVQNTAELHDLHNKLCEALENTGVEFTQPNFIGDGHRPHVSKRKGIMLRAGQHHKANAAYLIEVTIQGRDHIRHVHARFDPS